MVRVPKQGERGLQCKEWWEYEICVYVGIGVCDCAGSKCFAA